MTVSTTPPPGGSDAAPPSAECPKHNRARWLDRLADAELFHGHHLAAERLADHAAALRGAA